MISSGISKANNHEFKLSCDYKDQTWDWAIDDEYIYHYFKKDLTRKFKITKWYKYNSYEEWQKSKMKKMISLYGVEEQKVKSKLFDKRDVYISLTRGEITVRQQDSSTGQSGMYRMKNCKVKK